MKRYYMLETNDADKSAELYIFGDITSYPWYEDGVSAYGLVKQLQDMDVEHIKVPYQQLRRGSQRRSGHLQYVERQQNESHYNL